VGKIITLKSGLRVYFQKKPYTRACAVGVFVGAGTVCEGKGEEGAAHFVEHLLFKGTQKRSAYDIAFEMEKKGININAYTSKTYTCYYTVGLSDFVNECLDVLSDMFFFSTFTEENIKREKGVVLEEINMYKDDGEDLCMEKLNELYFGKSPLAKPILGTAASVKGFNRALISGFTERFYSPENTVVSVAGNVDEGSTLDLIEKLFEDRFLANSAEKYQKIDTLPAAKTKMGYVYTLKEDEQSNVCIRFPSYKMGHKKEYAPVLVGAMLGGGMSSRLFACVREELGLVYEIHAGATHFVNNGVFDIFFATSPNQVCQAADAIKKQIERAIKDGFTEDELTKAKTQYISSLTLSGENSSDAMRIAGKSIVCLNKASTVKDCIKKIESVTMDDINEAVRFVFDFKKASLSCVGKKIECDDLLERIRK